MHNRLHVHLKKLTLNFKLLHLLNRISCFNNFIENLRDMSCEYSYTKSESLVQIRASIAEIHNFSKGLFVLLAHPVDHIDQRPQSSRL